MIRVLVAEDQAMVLGALSALLDLEDDIEVVARERDGAETLGLALVRLRRRSCYAGSLTDGQRSDGGHHIRHVFPARLGPVRDECP